MASTVDICNDALTILRQVPIVALTDTNDRARLCAQHFPAVLDEAIREYPWKCSLERQTLAQLATAPAWGYAYQYTLPTDPYCLRVWGTALEAAGARSRRKPAWVVEGRVLLTDEPSMSIIYGARITDPERIDGLLRSVLSHRLAARIAYPITGVASRATDLITLAEAFARKAKGVDGQEAATRYAHTTALTEVR